MIISAGFALLVLLALLTPVPTGESAQEQRDRREY